MPRQYKLRLGDGTVVAVDYAGLRTWLLDDKAMVQPAGSRGWRPLREVLAREGAAVAAPRAKRPSPPKTVSDHELPSIPPKPLDEGETSRPVATVPLAEPASPPRATPDEELAVIPLEPLDLGEVARRAVTSADEDIPIIPLKPLDESETPRSAAARPEPHEDDELVEELELVGEAPVAEDHEALEELELFPEDEVVVKAPKVRAPKGKALLGVVFAWLGRLLNRRDRPPVSSSPDEPAASWAAGQARREPQKPPPPLSELPVLRLAEVERAPEDMYEGESASGGVRPWLKRLVLIAGLAAGAIIAAATLPTWMPKLTELALGVTQNDKHVDTLRPSMPSPEGKPPLPKEVQVAIDQLPHLAPETIQLVIATAEFGPPDPAEVFRRAHAAASRGASALSEPEAQELRTLRSAVLAALRPFERERVRAYDRVRAGRDLLPAEDGKVLGLFGRGVRALPPHRRERLQALFGKAIAAALRPGAPPSEAAPRAPAGR